ncbi:MAG: PilZ domain-containing protein [Desulfobacterales bacterium]|nr:PilZ domain-containing protein [Desulfobacterales bacterium]
MQTALCENTRTIERRGNPRLPYRTTALIKCASVSGVGTIKDLSPGGLFLELPFFLERDASIRIEFKLRNSGRTTEVDGKIVRRTPAGVGVQFLWT